MRRTRPLATFPILASAVLAVCICALAACSSSPKSSSSSSASHKKRTILYSEYDDERVGRETSKSVAAQIGLLGDEELDTYIRDIGKKLLRGIPRRFAYQFSIVDQFEPNAFALPGGFIFISRGLLALANNEDQLACVIGHEITHAAKRHAAAQQELARRQNPLAMGWMRAANMAAYGRDMEREADRGGQMLCAAAGYDPMGMSTFLRDMGQMERLVIGHSRRPSFFDTHPGSTERAAANAARARELRWERDPTLGDTRVALLEKTDGMPLEQRPEGGIFQGDRFLHPDMNFQIRFPEGWRTQNANTAVGAIAPRGDAIVSLQADMPEGDPRDMAERFVAETKEEGNVDVIASQPVKLGEIDAWRVELEGGGRGGSVTMYAIFFPYAGATWRIEGMALSRSASKYRGRIFNTARSFRPLTDEERDSLESSRLQVVTALAGEDLTALGERTDNGWTPSRTAVYNGIFSNHRFEGGELVKVSQVEPYVPKPQ